MFTNFKLEKAQNIRFSFELRVESSFGFKLEKAQIEIFEYFWLFFRFELYICLLTIGKTEAWFQRETKTSTTSWMDVVGKPHKQHGAEAYYYFMINATRDTSDLE